MIIIIVITSTEIPHTGILQSQYTVGVNSSLSNVVLCGPSG